MDDVSEGIMIMLEWYTRSKYGMCELLTLAIFYRMENQVTGKKTE